MSLAANVFVGLSRIVFFQRDINHMGPFSLTFADNDVTLEVNSVALWEFEHRV